MNLNKKQEKELMQVYNAYWDNYIKGDAEGVHLLLDDRYTQVGSAEGEVFFNKKDAVQFVYDTIDQVAGKLDMRNRRTRFDQQEKMVLLIEQCDLFALAGDDWIFYSKFRASTIMHMTINGWKIVHQHSSFPDIQAQEGENIAIEKIAAENIQLREAVKRRTAELEHQNHELEIEASLERVRTTAMSMQAPEDLLTICEALFNELQALGFDSLRNALIHTFNDDEKFFTDYDYSSFCRGSINRIPYSGHPAIEKFIHDIRSSSDAFTELTITGKELDDWRAFRQSNNEAADARLETVSALYYYFYSVGPADIGISTFASITMQDRELLKRFRNVFDLAYRRYLDIEQAIEQTREAQIEAALEKVRSRSLAMHNSDELNEVVAVVFKKLRDLHIPATAVGISLAIEGSKDLNAFVCGAHETGLVITNYRLPFFEHVISNDLYNALDKQVDFFVGKYSKEEKNSFYEYLFEHSAINQVPGDIKRMILASESYIITMIAVKHALFNINDFEGKNLIAHEVEVIKRFANVFDQAYTRFLDLQKGEAQAREGEIQLGFERVRSSAMAMHSTNDFLNVTKVLRRQIAILGEKEIESIVIHLYNEKDDTYEAWFSYRNPGDVNGEIVDGKKVVSWSKKAKAASDKQHYYSAETDYTIVAHKAMLTEWYQFLSEEVPEVVDLDDKGNVIVPDILYYNYSKFTGGSLLLITNSEASEKSKSLLKRSAQVFEQAYTRFLDLQKAEAQAREAQIELGLEKVRTRAMAMQSSNELAEIVNTVFKELTKLAVALDRCIIMIYDPITNGSTWWLANPEPETAPLGLYVQYHEHKAYLAYINAWKKQTLKWEYLLEGVEKREWDEFLFKQTEMSRLPAPIIEGMTSFKQIFLNVSFNKFGSLTVSSMEAIKEEDFDILLRFAKVFESTYTRFNDLEQAEGQAREAQIQLALERVRARTMAMQHSNELREVSNLLFTQVQALGVPVFTCGYNIWEIGDDVCTAWMSSADGLIQPAFKIPLTEGSPSIRFQQSRQKGEDFYVEEMQGEDLAAHYRFLLSLPVFGELIDSFLNAGFTLPTFQINHVVNFKHGNLIFITSTPVPESWAIFKRLTFVFEQTYTRFLDLQKAEAQAREAEIELALERVRSRSMAMHKSEELANLSLELVKQIQTLGVTTWFCAFNIYDDDLQGSLEWGSNGQGTFPKYRTPREGIFLRYYEARQKNEPLFINKIGEDECPAHYEYLCTLPGVGEQLLKMKADGISFPTSQIDHVAFFKYGYIIFITYEPVPESYDIFKRFAKVFEQTYTRFLDLQKAEAQALRAERSLVEIKAARKKAEEALTNLRTTQKQLIQSEKMASLGELTAGIAHEIQNPLNFVNNFSEVSKEMLNELKEALKNGDVEEVNLLATDIIHNLDKINHHGKRADAIVKGMLQHSRANAGKKELTDINVLTDEYLRLSYHGLRAKDKSFNATLETTYDESIGSINIVPQDVGRAILNLITNAFYAVNEKKTLRQAQGDNTYEPTVSVSTKKTGHHVEIIVADNGPGIPQNILDKLFQPFFTTKPTGQGTGLGLSLAYDIIKAHGGEIKVETNEGEGSEFIIAIPLH